MKKMNYVKILGALGLLCSVSACELSIYSHVSGDNIDNPSATTLKVVVNLATTLENNTTWYYSGNTNSWGYDELTYSTSNNTLTYSKSVTPEYTVQFGIVVGVETTDDEGNTSTSGDWHIALKDDGNDFSFTTGKTGTTNTVTITVDAAGCALMDAEVTDEYVNVPTTVDYPVWESNDNTDSDDTDNTDPEVTGGETTDSDTEVTGGETTDNSENSEPESEPGTEE